jgi:predicted aspartyl protease
MFAIQLEVHVRLIRFAPWLLLAGFSGVSTSAENKPNFSGVWKLPGGHPPQIVIIDQNETGLRVFQFIEDRLAMVKGPIDGQPHSQIMDGAPCDFLARWEGDSLFFETRRPAQDSAGPAADTRYLMRLASDGAAMSVKRTGVPAPGAFSEKWEKQDPLHPETFLTGFDGRHKLDDPSTGLTGVEGNRLRGWMAYAFNDAPQAEREYLAIIDKKPPSEFRDEARANLTYVYARNGMVRKALQSCAKGDRAFYKQLAKYPEISVTHRGYARVQAARDPDGRIMLPVSAAGKDASLLVDTGSNICLLQLSEAKRLGLKRETLTRHMTDGLVKFDGLLAIMPALTVGATQLENVPFWVVPDAQLEWPGILGIDLLLKLETLRWSASGAAEIGFPAQEKNILEANLCFWDNSVLAEVSSSAQRGMVFFLDTGDNQTMLYPRFAASNLDLVSANGKRSVATLDAHGAHSELMELTMPEVTLRVGGSDATLRPAGVLLEKAPLRNERHGTIGMDLLNSVQRVTLDLQSMRLTLE